MMENTRILEGPPFLTRLGPGRSGGTRLEWGGPAGVGGPGWHPTTVGSAFPWEEEAPSPHHSSPAGLRGVSGKGLLSVAPSGTPKITVEGIMLEQGRTACQVWTCCPPSPGERTEARAEPLLLPVLLELRDADLCSEKGPRGHANASPSAAHPGIRAAGPVAAGGGGLCFAHLSGLADCALRWQPQTGGCQVS